MSSDSIIRKTFHLMKSSFQNFSIPNLNEINYFILLWMQLQLVCEFRKLLV